MRSGGYRYYIYMRSDWLLLQKIGYFPVPGGAGGRGGPTEGLAGGGPGGAPGGPGGGGGGASPSSGCRPFGAMRQIDAFD